METTASPTAKKKLHNAWAMYDWGNSAYNLVITSTIFPAYYIAITTDATKVPADKVSFFGMEITNTVLQDYTLSIAYLIIAFISPILSSIADYRGNKKRYMRFFTYIGAIACCGLFLFTKDIIELGIILFGLAAIGYCAQPRMMKSLLHLSGLYLPASTRLFLTGNPLYPPCSPYPFFLPI